MAEVSSRVRHRMKAPSKVVNRWSARASTSTSRPGAAGRDRRPQQVGERHPPRELGVGDQAVDVAPAELPLGEHGRVEAARLLCHQLLGALLEEAQERHDSRRRVFDAGGGCQPGVEVGEIGDDVALDQPEGEVALRAEVVEERAPSSWTTR